MPAPSKKRILIAGNWRWDIYEAALETGFNELGWEVHRFNTSPFSAQTRLAIQIQRFRFSPFLQQLNRAFLSAATELRPDILLLIRCDGILPATLRQIKAAVPGCIIMVHHNDNPFVGLVRRLTMRHYLNSLRYADLVLAYRPKDIDTAKAMGAKRVILFPPYYIRARHHPAHTDMTRDVVYVGHFEADGREAVMQALHDAGIAPTVLGTRWAAAQKRHPWLAEQDIRQVWGHEYAAALASARIALVFLSKRNQDVYTRRCFEIPACGSLMLAPRTRELEAFFTDGKEAVFWDNTADLITKIRHYLAHEDERAAIAAAGRDRLLRDGHDEVARARMLIDEFECMRARP